MIDCQWFDVWWFVCGCVCLCVCVCWCVCVCVRKFESVGVVDVKHASIQSDIILIMSASFSQDYKDINISWQQCHFQMTPLFAATLASQPGQTQMEQSVGTTSDGGIRATQQNLAFTPTQGM